MEIYLRAHQVVHMGKYRHRKHTRLRVRGREVRRVWVNKVTNMLKAGKIIVEYFLFKNGLITVFKEDQRHIFFIVDSVDVPNWSLFYLSFSFPLIFRSVPPGHIPACFGAIGVSPCGPLNSGSRRTEDKVRGSLTEQLTW